ncbi:LL-diaminopimelate aminotransferase [Trema orientale]|uniref:LL-diaminopimelate aminotransferase n=1 Tax=Trema orientale TaxID=63057 RepID=A0A2P5DNI2_TREOI|nr:LL-diaminopimelate aminotransferase [Trema orientale]
MESGSSMEWNFLLDEGEVGRVSSITVRGVINIGQWFLLAMVTPLASLAFGPLSQLKMQLSTRFALLLCAEEWSSFGSEAIAEHLSHDLPDILSSDDVYVTPGCLQAIEIIMAALARPGANEARAACTNLEVHHYDLIPERVWEIDLENVKALSDENTVAMVAEMARKLRFLVVAYEVYRHLTFGSSQFVPISDNLHSGICHLKPYKLILRAKKLPSDETLQDGAIPDILQKTKEEYFSKITDLLREAADTCYNAIKEIPFIDCPHKPEGSLFVMVKLNFSLLDDINDDLKLCLKLAQEESVVVLPGMVLGTKNWLRITLAIEPSLLEDGLGRRRAFCQRHAKKH